MASLPVMLRDRYFIDQSASFGAYGYGEPLGTCRALNDIPVSPILFGVLNIIIKIEFIHTVDIIEIPLPRNIVRLRHPHYFTHYLPLPLGLQTQK
jgi:hypothetical protein